MSAIVGILRFDGQPVSHEDIKSLVGRVKSYGPDAQGSWCDDNVALGHALLRTSPISDSTGEPIRSEDGRHVLVWAGRLDNRDELLHSLQLNSGSPRQSDACLALEAWRAWGVKGLPRLLGDFAFAVWDAVDRRLTCVRDAVGAQPLYITANDRFFAFSSDDNALVLLPGMSREPFARGIAHWFNPDYVSDARAQDDVTRHWYDAVRFVRAGEWITTDVTGQRQSGIYWTPDPEAKVTIYRSDAECIEAFVDVFGSALKARLAGVAAPAMLLSGGMDSAGIIAAAWRGETSELSAYSVISDQPETCVETQCILAMARKLGPRFHAVSIPSLEGAESISDLLEETWPFSHPEDNCVWLQAMLCRIASRRGHRVMLQGAHGDLTQWSPLRYIAYYWREGHWLRAWNECVDASDRHTGMFGIAPWRIALTNAGSAFVPAPLKAALAGRRQAELGSTARLLNPDFVRQIGWRPPTKEELVRKSSGGMVTVAHWHTDSLSRLTISRSSIPRVGGRHGLEMRDPWEDRRVIDFFLRLPLSMRVRSGQTKYLARTAFAADVGKVVINRIGKEHLGFQIGCRVLAETHQQVDALLNRASAHCWQYLDRGAARKSYSAYLADRPDWAVQDLLDVLSLSNWLDRVTV